MCQVRCLTSWQEGTSGAVINLRPSGAPWAAAAEKEAASSVRQSGRPVPRADYAGLSGQRRHEAPAAAANADDYEQLKLPQLVALCKERGLKSSGNKVHLVNYLRNPCDARAPSKGAKEAYAAFYGPDGPPAVQPHVSRRAAARIHTPAAWCTADRFRTHSLLPAAAGCLLKGPSWLSLSVTSSTTVCNHAGRSWTMRRMVHACAASTMAVQVQVKLMTRMRCGLQLCRSRPCDVDVCDTSVAFPQQDDDAVAVNDSAAPGTSAGTRKRGRKAGMGGRPPKRRIVEDDEEPMSLAEADAELSMVRSLLCRSSQPMAHATALQCSLPCLRSCHVPLA
jgi:hypothetical protein